MQCGQVFCTGAFAASAASGQPTGQQAAPPKALPKPNIVLILSDDHSYPYLGCYGYEGLKTPNFDRFAAAGIKFSRAFTTSPQCVPSRASLMTGRSPVAARITRFSSPLPREEITFPEILRQDAGYFVGVLGRNYHLDGAGRGPEATDLTFQQHNRRTFKDRFNYVDASGQQNVPAKMKEFFDQRPADKPFFLWVNFSDPHHPWTTGQNLPDPAKLKLPTHWPDLPGLRGDLSRYLGEVEHADSEFQRVLDILQARNAMDNTLILFMGDNGIALPRGKGSLHDPGCNVPLLARWPGVIKPGGDSSALISGEDIAPTCLQAAGLPVPARISGVSFLPLLRGEPFADRKYLFAERGPHGSATFNEKVTSAAIDYSRMVRSATHKLIYNVTPHIRYAPVDSSGEPGWKEIRAKHEAGQLAPVFEQIYFGPRSVYELYDLQNDPAELKNLAGRPETAAVEDELKAAMQKKMILDYDYLPLPIAPGPRNEPRQRNVAAGQTGTAPGVTNSRATQFTQKDLDKDGRLSRTEFFAGRDPKEAEYWLTLRDVNKDGFVSREEFLTNIRQPAPNKP